jgi:gamma-glutamylcyclotransferase (GGCT)/AIG2-like uncharacterized protein YtfP
MKSTVLSHVFVYGTLKPGEFYHDRYCGPFKFVAEEAFISGRLFDFPQLGYPGALEGDGSRIRGVILRFSHTEREVLSKLDELEGYDPDKAEELNEYYRKKIPVYKNADDAVTSESAWCYFMTLRKIESLKGVLIPNDFWPTKHPSA